MNSKIIHFIGIGGISMSALAIYLHKKGYIVQGSDLQANDETKKLNHLGISTFIGHNKNNIKNANFCVYNGAINEDNPELIYARKAGMKILERSQLLGLVTEDFKYTIAISGTHGKTTTTAMLAQIFVSANLNPTVHIGGDFSFIGGNFLYGDNKYFITEACEYKKSFLNISPQYAIITNVELDHTDCYTNLEEVYKTFYDFTNQVEKNIFINYESPFVKYLNLNKNTITFGFNKNSTYRAYNLRQVDNKYIFDITAKNNYIGTIKLQIPGKYNVSNALGSIALAHYCGIQFDIIKKALENFTNVERRFEFIKQINNADIFRDYAHHPTEIKNVLQNAKMLNYDKIICFFQPHTYSRTLGLFNDFLNCFDNCDKLYLLPTYSARENAIKGGKSEDLYEALKKIKKNTYFINKEDCLKTIDANSLEHNLILLIGAGDIGTIF